MIQLTCVHFDRNVTVATVVVVMVGGGTSDRVVAQSVGITTIVRGVDDFTSLFQCNGEW